MELNALKKTIEELTDEERFFAISYLRHLSQADDPVRQAVLGERMRRMTEGRKFTLEQAERLHDVLSREGL